MYYTYMVCGQYCIDSVHHAVLQTLQFKLSEQPSQHLLVMDGRVCLHEGSLKLIGETESCDSSICMTINVYSFIF